MNAQGQVLGMDTAGSSTGGFRFRTTSTGSAFAIPIDRAATLAKKFEAGNGSATVHIGATAFLGVQVSAGTSKGSSSTTSGSSGGIPGFTSGSTTSSSGNQTTGSGTGSTAGSTTTASSKATTASGSKTTGGSSTSGVVIAGVVSGTPAAGTGLAKGDRITSLGGQSVTTANSLSSILQAKRPGDKVKVVWVTSSGKQQSATVTLASGPAD